jgi:phosphoheptose isomerase
MRWLKAMLLTAEVAEEYAEERKGRPSSAASAKTSATSAVGFTELSPLDRVLTRAVLNRALRGRAD